jgi:plastocyanin
MKNYLLLVLICILVLFESSFLYNTSSSTLRPSQDTTHIDQEFTLEASMLGYFAKNGKRNPTLRVKKGNRVRITIINTELMTHDIALEKLGIKSNNILEKGSQASITFLAEKSDTYYCTVPGHRAAGMVGKLDVVDGELTEVNVVGKIPTKMGSL